MLPSSFYAPVRRREEAVLGPAQDEEGIGLVGLGTAIAGGFVLFSIQLLMFFLFRSVKRLAPIYKPSVNVKVDIKSIFTVIDGDDTTAILEIVEKCGMDAYLFLRYLRTQLYIFLPACVVALPVLIPLNFISGNGHSVVFDESEKSENLRSRVVGLDTLAWGNVRPENTTRYTAHLVCAIVIIVWACIIFFYEFRWYVNIRQMYLTSSLHRQSISATTVLVSSIPHTLLKTNQALQEADQALRKVLSPFNAGIKSIRFNRDFHKLLRTVKHKDKVQHALEVALTRYTVNVSKEFKKVYNPLSSASNSGRIPVTIPTLDPERAPITRAEWEKFEPKVRILCDRIPWLPGIPFLCKKRNAIDWYSNKLNRLNKFIAQEQQGILGNETEYFNRYPLLNSAYIQFERQIDAHMACQSIIHRIPWHMSPKLCEISPSDIIWGNMAITWWQELARTAAVVVVLTAMSIFWAIPVAWSAVLGQLSNLIQVQGWLSFLRRNAIIEYVAKALAGVLPAAVIELLLFVVPLILRRLARIKGARTGSQESEFIQTMYFIFLFIQVFLVISIASFFTVTLGEYLNNLKELQTVEAILNLLAQNLPKAANYFLCYMVLQSLATSSATLLQIWRLLSWFAGGRLSDVTPRRRWIRRQGAGKMDWGSFFPVYTNFACIGLIYSVIAPLILVCVVVMFLLLWLAHGYSMARVNHFTTDTGGVFYPRAINQTFTGLYVMELCVAGLFFCVVDEQGGRTCTVHGFIMIGLLILTIAYQIVINSSFKPFFNYLPVQLAADAEVGRQEFSSEEILEHHPAMHASQPLWIPEARVNAINEMVRSMIPQEIAFDNRGAAVLEGGLMEVYS